MTMPTDPESLARLQLACAQEYVPKTHRLISVADLTRALDLAYLAGAAHTGQPMPENKAWAEARRLLGLDKDPA